MMHLYFEFDDASIYEIKEVNSSFAVGSLRVMYTGQNNNGSCIQRQAVERALPSLRNVPIVCNWDPDAGQIGGHDVTTVKDKNGNLRLRNLTEPCGVVPEHAEFRFVTHTDSNGVEHEYLEIVGVLLWKRQDVYHHIAEDLGGKVSHSMEITVLDGARNDDGLYEIREFEFVALCLLEQYRPCFEDSELALFSADHFKEKMEQMMEELRETIPVIHSSTEEEDTKTKRFSTEGGKEILEEKMKIAAEYGIDIENLDFSVEDGNLIDEIQLELGKQTVEREWGTTCRYYYVDCDLEAREVYCWDSGDWLLYGFAFETNGDHVEISYETKKRMKYVIADFDEGDQRSPFAEVYSAMEEAIRAQFDLAGQLEEANRAMSELGEELNDLREFKAAADSAAAAVQREQIFAKFEDLVGIEAFEQLRDHCDECDLETLEEKCYAIRGRNGSVAKFSAETKAPKLVVEKISTDKEPYGGLFAEYGIE